MHETKSIIAANHDLLVVLARELHAKRILTAPEIQAILQDHPINSDHCLFAS